MEALKKMRDIGVRHLPVVDREGKPIGIVSLRDLAEALLALMNVIINAFYNGCGRRDLNPRSSAWGADVLDQTRRRPPEPISLFEFIKLTLLK